MANIGEPWLASLPEEQRNLIVQALMAQWARDPTNSGNMNASVPDGASYQYPADPADPADYSTDTSAANVHGPTEAAAAINANANANQGLDTSSGFNAGKGTTDQTSGSLAAMTGIHAGPLGDFSGNHPGYSPSSFTAAPLGDFTSVNTTNDFATNPDNTPDALSGLPNAMDIAAGFGRTNPDSTPDALSGLPNAIDVSQGFGLTGTPTGTPASTGTIASDVGVGLGISGGFGGATGDGTSGGFGGEAGGPGVGGASTGISGGPGGTGEGGANTGEGGGGSGGGAGAGK